MTDENKEGPVKGYRHWDNGVAGRFGYSRRFSPKHYGNLDIDVILGVH